MKVPSSIKITILLKFKKIPLQQSVNKPTIQFFQRPLSTFKFNMPSMKNLVQASDLVDLWQPKNASKSDDLDLTASRTLFTAY